MSNSKLGIQQSQMPPIDLTAAGSRATQSRNTGP